MLKKITYRPEIDGLRAIAVFSVICYHLDIYLLDKKIFSGGFLGVDIFFVISGYLITTIILNNYQKKNFYLNFIDRRIRRIIPLILVIFILSLLVGFFILLPFDFLDLTKSIFYALFGASNIYFYLTEVEYGLENISKPLLHLWSLSIEKQFYVIFPFFFLFLKSFTKKIKILILFFILLNILLIQFLGNLKISKPFFEDTFNFEAKTVFFNFYFITSRFWEFLVGSLIVFFEKKQIKFDPKIRFFFILLGFLLIFYSLFFFNDRIFHPSVFNLLPVIGTAIIIFLTTRESFFLLSTTPFKFIGKISYSLYLWHYPIISFLFFVDLDFNESLKKLIFIFFLIILSFFSYNLIEKPSRNFKISKKKFYIILLSIIILIMIICQLIIKNNGFETRVPEILREETQNKKEYFNHKIYQHKENVKNVILVGDSQLRAIKFDLKKRLELNNFNYAQSIYDGCQLIINSKRVDKKTLKTKLNCGIETQNERMNFLKKNPNSVIIIGGRLPLILSEKRFNNNEGGFEGIMTDFIQDSENSLDRIEDRNKFIFNQYLKTIKDLISYNNLIILIYPIPEVGWDVPRKIYNLANKNLLTIRKTEFEQDLKKNPIVTSFDVFKKRTQKSFDLLDSIKHPNIIRIYPHKLFCNSAIKGKCVTHSQKNIYYYDNNHLSIFGSTLLNNLIIEKIKTFNFND